MFVSVGFADLGLPLFVGMVLLVVWAFSPSWKWEWPSPAERRSLILPSCVSLVGLAVWLTIPQWQWPALIVALLIQTAIQIWLGRRSRRDRS